MKIKTLNIVNLYGYINKELSFNEDLTVLVGINGSGKTSVLNILNWILRPSLENLCVTEFKSITLSLESDNKNIIIKCTHNRSRFRYQMQVDNEHFNPLVIKLRRPPSRIGNNESLKQKLISEYSGLGPDENEKKTWEIISKFPKPIVIGLDRNLYAEESPDKIFFEESLKGRIVRSGHSGKTPPLERVKEIINREYRKQKNEILELTSSLKNHLMLSTFHGNITKESFSSGIRYKLTPSQITTAERRVNNYFEQFEESNFFQNEQEAIDKYFSDLKGVIKEYHDDPDKELNRLLYGLNANQFVKVRKLLKEFEKFDDKVLKIQQKVHNFLSVVNFFLKDSSKVLVFREDTSELTFNIVNANREVISQHRDINFLSSGEQQILILLSYLAFNSTDGKVFIIDEPELSLHIKWQEEFLDKLSVITPVGTQIVLATHSPILANKRREKSVLLLPYNS